MIQKKLYKYELENGGYTVTPEKPPKGTTHQIRWRLIAEEGQAITDGKTTVSVIDVQSKKEIEAWRDCEKPEETAPLLPENPWMDENVEAPSGESV